MINRRPTFVPSQLADDDFWYVQVSFADGHIDQVGVFCDEFETHDWIAHNSAAWLADYERRRMSDWWDPGASLVKLRVVN
jgi:hypothetical protein